MKQQRKANGQFTGPGVSKGTKPPTSRVKVSSKTSTVSKTTKVASTQKGNSRNTTSRTSEPRKMVTAIGQSAPKPRVEPLDHEHVGPFYASIREEFPDLEQFGFTLHESATGERWLEISAIRVPESARGTGLGSKVLKKVVNHADKNGWKLTVVPDARFAGADAGGMKAQTRLEKWYKSYGFVRNRGRKRDYEIMETMIREPQ